MSQPIQRDGVWWHQKTDGTWLRWNAQKSEWESAPAPPPPPPAPHEDSVAAVTPDFDAKSHGSAPAFGFSTAESGTPPTPDLPEGPAEVKWEFGDGGRETTGLGPANADVLPPESDKPSAGEWLNSSTAWMGSNRAVAALIALIVLAGAVFVAFTFMGGDTGTADGGDTPGTAIGTPLPKKAAVRKLNSLCKSANRRMKALGNPTTTAEFADFLGKARGEFKGFVRDLGSIKPRSEDKSDFNRIVNDFKKSLQYTNEALAAAETGNIVALQQTLVEFDSFTTKMRGRARAFGAHACAQA
jgi:hypothetical protein